MHELVWCAAEYNNKHKSIFSKETSMTINRAISEFNYIEVKLVKNVKKKTIASTPAHPTLFLQCYFFSASNVWRLFSL